MGQPRHNYQNSSCPSGTVATSSFSRDSNEYPWCAVPTVVAADGSIAFTHTGQWRYANYADVQNFTIKLAISPRAG